MIPETSASPRVMISASTAPGPSARWVRRRTSSMIPTISTGYIVRYTASPNDGKGTVTLNRIRMLYV